MIFLFGWETKIELQLMEEILISSNGSNIGGLPLCQSFGRSDFFLSKIPAPQIAADETKTTLLGKSLVVILRVFFSNPEETTTQTQSPLR